LPNLRKLPGFNRSLKAQNFQIDYSHDTSIKSKAKAKIKIATVISHQKWVQTGVKFYISWAVWFNRRRGAATEIRYPASFLEYIVSITNYPSSQRELDTQIRMCRATCMPQCLRCIWGVIFI